MQTLRGKRNLKKKSDWELIQACREGEQTAWTELVLRYERLVAWIPYRQYGMTETDAADIAQTVFTILMNSLDSFHAESNIKSWLMTVTRRHTWRLLQKNDRETIVEEADLIETTLAEGVDEREEVAARQWETADWLNSGLYQLDPKCRALLTGLYLDQNALSYEKVAEQIGMKVGSIGATRARCLKKLRQILEQQL